MESASKPGGSDDRKEDESENKQLETEETKGKKESESSLRRNLSSSRKRNKEKLPTVFSYQTTQKHAFKEGDNNENNKKPAAPRYYTNQVKPEQHQPRMLVPQKEDSKTRTSTQSMEAEQTTSRDEHIQYENTLPNFNVDLWATYPRSVPSNVPAYLALLHNTDTVLVIQQLDFIELALQFDDMPNLYLVQNTNGECLYYAYETSSMLGQLCMRGVRNLQVHVMDFYNNEVIYINKTCGSNNFFCCYPVVEVYSPPLQPLGAIYRRPYPLCARFDVVDVSERRMFKIRGPNCCFYGITTGIVDFTIQTVDGNDTEVGVIKREIPIFSFRAGAYGLTFPSDLDVKMKAVLLGAVFFISLKRTGWVLRNVEDPETVSGHMYRMSVMTFLIPETSGVDKTRCMKLSIVHDLAECIVGDLTPYCGVEPSEKHRQEDAAMKELTQMIGESGTEIYKLYKEYEAQVTDESKFVKDLDRLDMVLQAYEYEKMADKPGKLEEFFTSTLNKFHFPWTIDIVKELYKQRNLHINKGKV